MITDPKSIIELVFTNSLLMLGITIAVYSLFIPLKEKILNYRVKLLEDGRKVKINYPNELKVIDSIFFLAGIFYILGAFFSWRMN